MPGANSALQFDGVNDFLSAGASAGGGPVTVEMWLRPSAANETGIVLLGGNEDSGWSFEMENGRIVFWVRTNQGWQSGSHPTVLQSAGVWYHVAATYNAGVLQHLCQRSGFWGKRRRRHADPRPADADGRLCRLPSLCWCAR